MYCSNCGNKLNLESKYCSKCGNLLNKNDQQENKPQKNKSGLKIGLLIIFLWIVTIISFITFIFSMIIIDSTPQTLEEDEYIVTPTTFYYYMTDNNYTISPYNEYTYNNEETSSYIATKENIKVQFIESTNEEYLDTIYNKIKNEIEDEEGNLLNQNSEFDFNNYHEYTILNTNKYMKVIMKNNTIIYSNAPSTNKEEIDEIYDELEYEFDFNFDTNISGMIFLVSLIIMLTTSLTISILNIVGLWKIFKKASKPGWASIIPFYNLYVLFEIAMNKGIYFLFTFIPMANIVFTLLVYYKLAKSFGKSDAYAVGMMFLNPIFIPMLGFDSSNYKNPV